LFNEKRTVKSHSSPFLSVQLHNVVTQRFLDDISTDGGVWKAEGREWKVTKVEPAEETCAETPANRAHTSHLMQRLSSVTGGYFNSCDIMARNLQNNGSQPTYVPVHQK
jgi:hypothetical protein